MALVASSRTFAEELKRCGDPPVRVGDLTVTSAPAEKDALAEQLRKFPSKRGLSLHQSGAHPDIYHREKIPTVVRKGWSHDECVFVAREELRLVGEARKRWVRNRVNVNADLCRACPHRSLEAIKGLRKNDKYITLRETLGQQESESPPTEPPESPVKDYSVQNTRESGPPLSLRTVLIRRFGGARSCWMRLPGGKTGCLWWGVPILTNS